MLDRLSAYLFTGITALAQAVYDATRYAPTAVLTDNREPTFSHKEVWSSSH